MANELIPIDPETPDPDEESGDLLRSGSKPAGKRPAAGKRLSRVQMTYEGPFPPPSMLKQFDEISPGLAEKIVENSLEQSRHRRELEKHVIKESTESRKLGMYIGGGLGFTALVGAIVTAGMGQPWVAGVLVSAVVSGLVTSFFGSYKRQEAEIEGKSAERARIASSGKPEPPESPEPPERPSSPPGS